MGLICATHDRLLPRDTVHSRLRRARLNQRLSQEWVANHLGVKTSTVHGWETHQMPRFDKVVALARLYGISLDELAGVTT